MVDGFKVAGDIIKVSPNRKVYDIWTWLLYLINSLRNGRTP